MLTVQCPPDFVIHHLISRVVMTLQACKIEPAGPPFFSIKCIAAADQRGWCCPARGSQEVSIWVSWKVTHRIRHLDMLPHFMLPCDVILHFHPSPHLPSITQATSPSHPQSASSAPQHASYVPAPSTSAPPPPQAASCQPSSCRPQKQPQNRPPAPQPQHSP